MMLHRSASSRRRRASRNFTNSSGHSAETSPAETATRAAVGRRASVATEKPVFLLRPGPNALTLPTERHRSPRGSILPDIALDIEEVSPPPLAEMSNRRFLPDPEQCSIAARGQADSGRSPRNSLIPDDSYRSSRTSLIAEVGRSPRNSLVPDVASIGGCSSPRNSLTPESPIVPRSPRHSIVPDSATSPRNSLAAPDMSYNRSPRNSLVPGTTVPVPRSPRHSLVPGVDLAAAIPTTTTTITTTANAPMCSGLPGKSPRGSTANLDSPDHHSPRGSIGFETSRTPRGSLTTSDIAPLSSATGYGRSPRGSIVSEYPNSQSPRGSICPGTDTGNRSPRGSIAPHYDQMTNRSASRRGSLGLPGNSGLDATSPDRRVRHIGNADGPKEDEERSPRGSIGAAEPILERSPRGSFVSAVSKATGPNQTPRKLSADQGISKNRSTYPHGPREMRSGSVKSTSSAGQTNFGYGTNAWADSRRASSSVSQVSADESRRLCGGNSSNDIGKNKSAIKNTTGPTSTTNLRIATYGSLAFQLKDAHLEASGTCDFVFRALRVVRKTTIVTICLACLSTMPILMFIMGLQFIKDCPQEPHIPLYMIVGGTLGAVRMFWALYSQIRSRRPESAVPGTRSRHISPMKLASIALSCFLACWFALGNYWILKIKWPVYTPTLFEPREWCHKTLYTFSLVHLCVVYAALGVSLVVALGLAFCRILACPWPERYK